MGNSYLLLEFVGLKDNAEGVHDVMMLRFLKIRVKILPSGPDAIWAGRKA